MRGLIYIDIQHIVALIESLPDEKSRGYDLTLTKFTEQFEKSALEKVLLEIINGAFPEKVRYSAFFCLNVLYQHNKDFPKIKQLIETYKCDFELHVTFDHIVAWYNVESDAIYDYTELLKSTYKDAIMFTDNAGFIHMFAVVFANIYEKGGLHDKAAYINTWYDRALEAVNNAISLDPLYAKYYCTKARILCIKGSFDDANLCIDKAIALENSSRTDYALRISTYQYYKMMIYTDIKFSELQNKFSIIKESSLSDNAAQNESHDAELPSWYDGSEPYVFISYSHEDNAYVYPVLNMLQKKGIRFWYDKGIPTGANYFDYIGEKINDCRLFMPLISSNTIKSEFVRKEFGVADRRKKEFFAIFLEDVILSPGMDLQIGNSQRVNYYNNAPEQNIKAIMRDLPKDVISG